MVCSNNSYDYALELFTSMVVYTKCLQFNLIFFYTLQASTSQQSHLIVSDDAFEGRGGYRTNLVGASKLSRNTFYTVSPSNLILLLDEQPAQGN